MKSELKVASADDETVVAVELSGDCDEACTPDRGNESRGKEKDELADDSRENDDESKDESCACGSIFMPLALTLAEESETIFIPLT